MIFLQQNNELINIIQHIQLKLPFQIINEYDSQRHLESRQCNVTSYSKILNCIQKYFIFLPLHRLTIYSYTYKK